MQTYMTDTFKKAIKTLSPRQREELEQTIKKKIQVNIEIGELKVGSLKGVRTYNFCIQSQPALLIYGYSELGNTLTLLAFVTHENFYRSQDK